MLEDAVRLTLKSVLLDVAEELLPRVAERFQLSKSRPEPTTPILSRTAEAAKLLAISERTVWELTRQGVLPCVRLNRLVRYDRDALRVWIAGYIDHAV